jgi:hypothetical protein
MASEVSPTAEMSPQHIAARRPIASKRDASSREPRNSWRWDIAVCLLLGLASFLIYNANLRSIPAADTYAARYLPFSIWRNHSVVLDPIAAAVAQGRKIPTSSRVGGAEGAWWIRKGREEHLISFYPIVVPLVVAPLYLPAVVYLEAHHWDPLLLDSLARIMEKLCASLLATASVMLLYLLMRRRCEPKTAALLTLAFALGTTTWVVSSQALWTHGLAQLLIVATLLLLTGPCSPPRAIVAGLVCALIVCNRPPDAILAAGLGFYALWWAGRMIPLFLAAAALPIGLVLAYNLKLVGHIVGGYGLVSRANISDFLNDDPLAGVAGLLFSPTRGLFVFSPFLLFIPCCLLLVFRERSIRGLTAAIGFAAVLQLVFYGLGDWRQGASWGPRWLTDMLPILFWMLPPILSGLSAAGRVVFNLACGLAIAIQVVGAFWYTGVSDAAILAGKGPDRMRAAWDVRNTPFIAELKHPRAATDLVVDLRGNIDLVTVLDNGNERPGRRLEVHGWALTNSRSPADVAVRIDGRLSAGTSDFFTRADVVHTTGEASPSGWRIAFSADQLAPGEHVLTALVRAYKDGEPRILKETTFAIKLEDEADRLDRELANAAQRAAKVLTERQQSRGYWLTTFTGAARFEQPHQEMNTYLNAIMIDVVGPVAEAAGVAQPLGRARDFLASQIEAGGLVRYHGRPDAPTIGSLGCAITPDADDTALVWRVAAIERPDLRSMALATLGQFRTSDGLYRTWLAPQDQYECLDPGRDPNPADIAIQIHVFMLLAQADPPSARALCEALEKRSDDEDIWVYYKNAPLMLILRLTDLQKADCPLQISQTRLQTIVPGQQVWIDAARLLQTFERAQASSPMTYSETAALLRKLAEDEFSLLARDPPLLYHNDLTASVRRFYWSEELGYALWLRLYFENERSRKSCRGNDAKQECVRK